MPKHLLIALAALLAGAGVASAQSKNPTNDDGNL